MKTERCKFLKDDWFPQDGIIHYCVVCNAIQKYNCPKNQLKFKIGARCWSVKINVKE